MLRGMSEPDPEAEIRARLDAALAQVEALAALAKDAGALGAALGKLAAAEAALSVNAFKRALVLKIAGALVAGLAALYLLLALTVALAAWLQSAAGALLVVGLAFGALAGVAFWRAKRWRDRIGFRETRAALADLREELPR